jgi:hypothetical protein
MSEPNATDEEKFTDGIRPRWWPRVPQALVRRLYENDAEGIIDEDLIADVGTRLHQRCESILIVTEAHDGRAKCARCDAIIEHGWDKRATMRCPGCGWETTWGAYLKTYQDKQLHGGGALAAFQAYVDQYPRARGTKEQLLLIDRLIHAFHCELQAQPSRPAACNLIGGKIQEVAQFLDNLAYGPGSRPELREEYGAWVGKVERTGDWFRSLLEENNPRRNRPRTGD